MLFEQQIQQTQKLESLGVLSGGIAHDFNNILAIIIGYCSLTKMDYETAENNITEIEKAAERASGLCRQMLAYAGKATLTQTQVNLRMLVDDMITMLKSTLPLNTVIKPELSANIPLINADASQLRQVVMNLIINASEAIGKEHGEILVSLVRAAVNGKEALQLYQTNATDITLVMTDMGMPMMDGYELFYELKKLNPELPIIVSSGYGDAEVSSRISIDNIAGLISKPFGAEQLREVLKTALEG